MKGKKNTNENASEIKQSKLHVYVDSFVAPEKSCVSNRAHRCLLDRRLTDEDAYEKWIL